MKSDGEFIEIGLGRRWQRAAVGGSVLVLGLTLMAAAARHAAAHWRGPAVSMDALRRAAAIEPDNAELHLQLARLSLVSFDLPAAEQSYLAALRHNSSDARGWLEYSFVCESQGKAAEAHTALLQALQVAPASAKVKKAAGDFFARRGEWAAATRYFRAAVSADAAMATPVIETCWQWAPDRRAILSDVLPQTAPAIETYLQFVLARQDWDEAARAWQWARHSGRQPGRELSVGYVDALLANHRAAEAGRVWRQLYPNSDAGANLIHNAKFQQPSVNGGFDWRYTPAAGVDVAQASAMLALRFSGNPDYWHLTQIVPVQPGAAYRLRAALRAEGIASTSGPRLEVRESYTGSVLGASEPLLGTTGWEERNVEFQAPADAQVVTIGLRRPAAPAWDEAMSGTLWLRDFSMQFVDEPRAAGLIARR